MECLMPARMPRVTDNGGALPMYLPGGLRVSLPGVRRLAYYGSLGNIAAAVARARQVLASWR
jgi:hypothetical protein